MTDAKAEAVETPAVRERRTQYQWVLGFNMLLHLIVGLLCIFARDFVSTTVGLSRPVPAGWIQGWGATLILVTALYIPGLKDPLGARYPNVCGIFGRLWMATVWLLIGGGFFYLGIFDLLWFIVIAFMYRRLLKTPGASP